MGSKFLTQGNFPVQAMHWREGVPWSALTSFWASAHGCTDVDVPVSRARLPRLIGSTPRLTIRRLKMLKLYRVTLARTSGKRDPYYLVAQSPEDAKIQAPGYVEPGATAVEVEEVKF